MHAVLVRTMLAVAALSAGIAPAAAETTEREPGPRSTGKVYAWKSAGGLRYEYFVPASYDPAKGANLTFICHGTGLDRRWGFANHPAGEFRPDDIVVSADGPTEVPGARLYANGPADLEALHALQVELSRVFKVRQVFLYGHSQGAFWVLLYAARWPDEVAGALAQAGGVWTNTPVGPAFHHQALVLMHGTADPVVPYGNSRGGVSFLRGKGYPLARLRALEGWNHWPSAFHAGQMLAWIEGMTTGDADRALASLRHFEEVREKEWIDFSALHSLARRVASLEGVGETGKARAEKAAAAVETLAAEHAAAVRAGAGKERGAKFDGGAWIGVALRFLRDFRGVPAREELARDWEKLLARHEADAVEHLRDHYRTRQGSPAKAFGEGVLAVRNGYLHEECADPAFLKTLEEWAKEAGKLKLDPSAVKAYRQIVVPYAEALEKGWKEYAGRNRRF